MASRVVVGPQALDDLLNIETYIMERSPSGARNVMMDIKATFEMLEIWPLVGGIIEGTTFRNQITPRYRYRLVYRVKGDILTIKRVNHPRQLPEERGV